VPFSEETFSMTGSPVAILTAVMMKNLAALAVALACTAPLAAQNWSIGAGTGPFVFGDFLERTVRIGNGEGPGGRQTLVLSAGTRAGLAVDLERRLGDRWAIRLEGAFTRAPLRLEQAGTGGDGAELDQGDLDVTTVMLPVVFRINPNGAFRFHLMGGPAVAFYRGHTTDTGTEAIFEEAQTETGVAFGGGVAWWMSDRFAIEGNLTDITTGSPFEREDFASTTRVDIKRPHNVHTTVGIRWKF
jgi:opacity protein-like surface antigen